MMSWIIRRKIWLIAESGNYENFLDQMKDRSGFVVQINSCRVAWNWCAREWSGLLIVWNRVVPSTIIMTACLDLCLFIVLGLSTESWHWLIADISDRLIYSLVYTSGYCRRWRSCMQEKTLADSLFVICKLAYHQVSNIRRTLVGN